MIQTFLKEHETERLIIRPVQQKDAKSLHEVFTDQKVNDYVNYPLVTDMEETMEKMDEFLSYPANGLPEFCVVVLKENNKLIGTISYEEICDQEVGEIGFQIRSDYWDRGYGKEALNKMLEIGFSEIGLRKVIARCSVSNKRSNRVIAESGFTLEGVERKQIYDKISRQFTDCNYYGILKEEWGISHERIRCSL